ncbi:hypothetical protein OSG_eHP27_00155 [environmental Halophage eHP-27]|nr:hypothetical protein OSG_eHP27_00155 [environmental Halophage eHP-27]
MVTNPFIKFATDPVGVLAWLGYAFLLVGIVFTAVPWAFRQGATLVVQYRKNRHTDAWWSFGARRNGYLPPLGWLSRAFGVCIVLAVTAWAVSALFWLVGV